MQLKLATATFSLPFIFDQPEDDLDNDFIQNELVPLFRRIKNYRQLIIATHDANIVVNSNAEQIIIANNDKEELSYITGGLEDAYIREMICDILEGGQQIRTISIKIFIHETFYYETFRFHTLLAYPTLFFYY